MQKQLKAEAKKAIRQLQVRTLKQGDEVLNGCTSSFLSSLLPHFPPLFQLFLFATLVGVCFTKALLTNYHGEMMLSIIFNCLLSPLPRWLLSDAFRKHSTHRSLLCFSLFLLSFLLSLLPSFPSFSHPSLCVFF